MPNLSVIDRMIAKRNITATGCWEFTGWKNNKGYGMIGIGKKLHLCHRVSYQNLVAPIPDGYVICHKCDNPSCFNPEHLFAGTLKDNYKDMVNKNRRVILIGENSSNAKLTQNQVQAIRKEYKPAISKGRGYKSNTEEIAKKYGITKQYVLQLVNNTWRKNG